MMAPLLIPNIDFLPRSGPASRLAQRAMRIAMAGVICLLSFGCEAYNITYNSFTKNLVAPSGQATTIHGTIEMADLKAIFEKKALPSTKSKQQFELNSELSDLFSSQIGSSDYVLIGEVFGGGNGNVTFDMLDAAFCQKAAAHGGDVVLVFNRHTEDHPYASSFASGDQYFATGYAEGGVISKPIENGLVFKYVPGRGQERLFRQRIYQQLSDEDSDRLYRQILAVDQDGRLTLEQADAEISALVRAAATAMPSAATESVPQRIP